MHTYVTYVSSNGRKILKDESKDEVYEIDVEVDQVDEVMKLSF